MKNITIASARKNLPRLASKLSKKPDQVIHITRNGKSVITLLSSHLYESLRETLEIISDESLMKDLRQSLKEALRGKTIPWNVAKRRLGLDK